MHLQVIKAGKNTLLGDSQTSGKGSKIKAVICFKGIAQQITDEVYHLVIVPCLKGFIQRNIILIDQQDDLLTIMLGQKHGEGFQTINQCVIGHSITCRTLHFYMN